MPTTFLTNQIQTQYSIIDHNNHIGILNMLNALITNAYQILISLININA